MQSNNSAKKLVTYSRRPARRPAPTFSLLSPSPERGSPSSFSTNSNVANREYSQEETVNSEDPFAFASDERAEEVESGLSPSPERLPAQSVKRKRATMQKNSPVVEIPPSSPKRIKRDVPSASSSSSPSPPTNRIRSIGLPRPKEPPSPSPKRALFDFKKYRPSPAQLSTSVDNNQMDISHDIFDFDSTANGGYRQEVAIVKRTPKRVKDSTVDSRIGGDIIGTPKSSNKHIEEQASTPAKRHQPQAVGRNKSRSKSNLSTDLDEGLGPSLPDDMEIDVHATECSASDLSGTVVGDVGGKEVKQDIDVQGMEGSSPTESGTGSSTPIRRAISFTEEENSFINSPNKFAAVARPGSRVARMKAGQPGNSPTAVRRTVSFNVLAEESVKASAPSSNLFAQIKSDQIQLQSSETVVTASTLQSSSSTTTPAALTPGSRIVRTYARRALSSDSMPTSPTNSTLTAPPLDRTNSYTAVSVQTTVGITYGRTRSFLEDAPEDHSDQYESEVRRRREEELETSSEDEERKEVKSLHEIRESGEARRFTDEMDYFLDGLRGEQPVGVRRSSCLELMKKMLSSKYIAKVRSHDYVPRLYGLLHSETDAILLALLTLMLLLLAQEKRNIEVLLREPDLFEVLARVLGLTADPLKGEWGSTKFEKRMAQDVAEIFASADVLEDAPRPLGLDIAVVMCLDELLASGHSPYIRGKLRESGLLVLLGKIVIGLGQRAKQVAATSVDDQTSSGGFPFDHVNKCMRALDYAIYGDVPNQAELTGVEGFVESVMDAIVFCRVSADTLTDADEMLAGILHHLQTTHTRERTKTHLPNPASRTTLHATTFLMNFTNHHEACSNILGTSPFLDILLRLAIVPLWAKDAEGDAMFRRHEGEMMGEDGGGDEGRPGRDELGMALLLSSWGLLINIVEFNAGNRERVRRVELSTRCKGFGEWSKECSCGDKESALALIVDIAAKRKVISPEDANGDEAVAYLAILLGCLTKDNPANRRFIKERMPSKSFKSAIDGLTDFVQKHQDRLPGAGVGGEGGEADPEAASQASSAARSLLDAIAILKEAEVTEDGV
ncbi:hypothetical protein HDV00_012068 [Rhizophlyctis rosea]|nr:hypothetical protein HDV00_012068 [Rhizophlyctis rosea]